MSLLVGLNATAIITASHEIAEQFPLNDYTFQNSFWPVTVWNTATALGPIVEFSLLENFGMRTGYLVRVIPERRLLPQLIAS